LLLGTRDVGVSLLGLVQSESLLPGAASLVAVTESKMGSCETVQISGLIVRVVQRTPDGESPLVAANRLRVLTALRGDVCQVV
jgi:hypothetical protein